MKTPRQLLLISLSFACSTSLFAQVLIDPGFEEASISSGGFVKPTAGAWLFGNDAGVVEPFSPNSSTGSLNTWSATFSAIEGQQYASTYAGIDTIRQAVLFPSAGTYRLSVFAAAPDGAVTIPAVGTFSLVEGEFTLTLNNVAIGSPHALAPGSTWGAYDASFTISAPGTYDVGVRNTRVSSYFINYDSFSLTSVPEPLAGHMLAIFGAVALARRRLLKGGRR